jgi:predicted DNA-binding protein
MKERSVTIQSVVPPKIKRKLQYLADMKGTTVSNYVRELLEAHTKGATQ